MKKLNLACGDKYHKDWVNIDFNAYDSNIIKVNLLKPLPFEKEEFDVVYTSHFLEHLNKEKVQEILREVFRVMKDDGIVRVVVPDLENICKEYLNKLSHVLENKSYESEYDWILTELLDQLVRNKRGGRMLDFFLDVKNKKNIDLANYILYRTGDDVLFETSKIKSSLNISKIVDKMMYFYLKIIKFLIPKSIRNSFFVETAFGERHQWMYDKFSLKRELENAGFRDVEVKKYNESNIEFFNEYCLDSNIDHTPYKGVSSLYIEAKK